MAILLFPGRHLLTTAFQERYLALLLRSPAEKLPLLAGQPAPGPITEIIFAITSANQANSRYNPVPLEIRAVGLDRFARQICGGMPWRMIPIPHYAPTARFAEFLLKEIAEATEGELLLSPANAMVLTSTPEMLRQFQAKGFAILPAELASLDPPRFGSATPVEVLQRAVASADAPHDAAILEQLSAATRSLWQDFPDVLRRITRLWRDPLLTEQGSLTPLRNYSTYARGMGEQAILDVKYADIHHAIRPGRIVDEGCADGALLVPIARDFPDSDLIGIEITGEFVARCHERQRALEYGGTFIHFHQRNLMEPIFQANSIDTTICNSTTHEIWSYGEREKSLRAYLAEKHRQLRPGGRLIIRDVVGPAERLREVYLWCNAADGEAASSDASAAVAAVQRPLERQSTAVRFAAFGLCYLHEQIAAGHRPASDRIAAREEIIDGRSYAVLPLHQAMEFLLKKDYLANWRSEMNEEFCFWDFATWKGELAAAGFRVLENPNDSASSSRAYASEWIILNRFEGKAKLFQRGAAGELVRLDWPVTNMVLVGQK